uniref:WASP homolog associated with actin, golgi membranes and microtubules n=1 Tax=Cyclopterus lumpus TaxID=8103 RepID=A0A8C2X7D4_CYCLU
MSFKSLEGWVAVKSNIFEELEPFKLGFIVQWNVIECKFAVTCHNRTLQRQRRKAEEVPGDPQMSWAGLFSVCDLKHVHQQFECVADVLGTCFPDLSQFEDGNIWDLLFLNRRSGPEDDDADERDFEAPCRKLEKYFSAAIDICGRKIVLDTLFTQDERDVEEYFENLQEFKRKTMQEEISRAKGLVRQLLQSHSSADRMVALLSVYEEEDEAYQDLVTVATTFFQYLLQPFRDMRELACLYKMEILKSLEFEDLGPKRIAALEKEAEEWRMKADDAVASIQDITVTYFAQTSKALAGMLKQMEDDKCRFGAAAWASAAPRLEKLRFLLAKETLQHMRAAEMCLSRKKEGIRQQIIQGGFEHNQNSLLELKFYETQLELYDTKFEILKNEEQLLVAQIDTVRRQIKELKEEVVYYDVCEDLEELQSMLHTGAKQTDPPAVSQLKRRLQTLETKRGNICARRAYLRNKKVCGRSEKVPCPSQPLSIISLGPPGGPPSIRPTPRRSKTPKKQQPKDIPVQIYSAPPPPTTTCPTAPPPPPPLPPPPPPPPLPPAMPPPPDQASPSSEDTPRDAPSAGKLRNDRRCILSLSRAPSSIVFERVRFPLSSFFTAGTMDEVLASLQRGQIQLRKAPTPRTASPAVGTRSNLMSAIRQGVTLKKVRCSTADGHVVSYNDLERSIKAAMMRMKKVAADSDDDDRGDDDETHSTDWDS